ncbi:hypothetical protein [Rhodococcus sp. JS3073]|uniref:hypothetical protein n=1 Tax=Rhodococcus sp. JS3073 TaxID=3002901 RepID=UPI0022864905|nr:hypothetical protein [Rhodococcus sp. JS3073]WAM17510.1 hypothetical protein OYT95_13095 [Rhodococcus sp. JS3073]
MTAIPKGVPAPLHVLWAPPKAKAATKAATKAGPKVVAKKKTSALHNAERDAEVARARLTGRISASRVAHFKERYDSSPYETRRFLRNLQPTLVDASSLSPRDAAWLKTYEARASKTPEVEPRSGEDLSWFGSSETKQDPKTSTPTNNQQSSNDDAWF